MEVKIYNKTLIPTDEELNELIGIANLLASSDEESILLGENLYKNSLYFKRTRRYKYIIKTYYELYNEPTSVYKTIRNIYYVSNFIQILLNGIGYNYPVIIKRNNCIARLIEICNA